MSLSRDDMRTFLRLVGWETATGLMADGGRKWFAEEVRSGIYNQPVMHTLTEAYAHQTGVGAECAVCLQAEISLRQSLDRAREAMRQASRKWK